MENRIKVEPESTPAKYSSGINSLYLGLVSVTLYFGQTMEDPFNAAKLIILMLMAAWLSGHIINHLRTKQSRQNITSNNLLKIVALLLMAMLISTLQTQPLIIGFFGDTQRRNGFVFYLCLTIILVYTSFVANYFSTIKFYKISVATGFLMSVYGVLQISGKDFVQWENPNNNMISTLGNPNFASALLAVLTILSVVALGLQVAKYIKFLATATILLSIYAIIESKSIQGLVVILISGLVLVSGLIIRSKTSKLLKLSVLAVFFLVLVCSVLGMLQKGPLQNLLYKDSVSVRGFYWRAAIEMLKSEPLFGVGSDRYGSFFREFRESDYVLRYGYDITSSNAHNVILQLFSTNGIIVGLIYISLLSFIFIYSLKKLKSSSDLDFLVILGLFSAWIGFQSQAFISIDNPGISIWGWVIGGLLAGYTPKKSDGVNKSARINPYAKNNQVTQINIFQVLTSMLFLIPALYIGFLLYRSENDAWIARSEFSLANVKSLEKRSNSVVQNPLSDPLLKLKVATYLFDRNLDSTSVEIMQKLLVNDPRNVDILRVMSIVSNKNQEIESEIRLREKIIELDPWDATNYLQLLKLYKGVGELSSANLMLAKINSFASGSDISIQAEGFLKQNE